MLAAALVAALLHGVAGAESPRITKAWLEEPTSRYGHDVLGGNEYAAMVVLVSENAMTAPIRVTLPPDRVFEDIEARLADLDGDGAPEIVVVEAGRDGGAQLTVWTLTDGALTRIAATPPIGRAFRWLAPAGIADFDGDGQTDIAYVETPHLAGILRFWTLRDDALVEIAVPEPGFSNHRIGEDFITSHVRSCEGRPELLVPDRSWNTTLKIFLDQGRIIAQSVDAAPTADLSKLACAQ
ncbi:MAG: VCBS repeat-containing protein [Pseudomonadota bacterium]